MTKPQTSVDAHEETRAAWNANAAYWDARMGDTGNDFVNELIWPAARTLLDLQAGERVLDIGCGNGLYARRLVTLGGEVVAFDFAEEMIARARSYQSEFIERLTYHVLDATDEDALLTLGSGSFDVAFSTMALMDIADLEPLFRALPRLLKPKGRFVFATAHPCFNNVHAAHVAEMVDDGQEMVTTYAIKVSGYMTPAAAQGIAIPGQPQAQYYFDRPLHQLLGIGFRNGFVVDGLEERTFAPENQPRHNNPLGWSGHYREFPPVLVVRMRLGS